MRCASPWDVLDSVVARPSSDNFRKMAGLSTAAPPRRSAEIITTL